MSDSFTRDSRIHRSRAIHELLENSFVKDAFEAIESRFTKIWRNTDAADTEKRERAWLLLRALDEVRAELQRHVDTGKMELVDVNTAQYSAELENADADDGGPLSPFV